MQVPSVEIRSAAKQQPSTETQQSSSALDQYRGFALVLVLTSHVLFFVNSQNGVGRLGVNLFFFISGLLVFRSLNSKAATTQPKFSRALFFWKKRLIRLSPALLGYLAVMTLVTYVSGPRPGVDQSNTFTIFVHSLPYALFYFIDFDAAPPCCTGQLWSVSVEMQFYLIAPIILYMGGRSRMRNFIVWATIGAAFALLGINEVVHGSRGKYEFQSTVWPMMFGFLLESQKKHFTAIPCQWLRNICFFCWFLTIVSLTLMLFAHQKIVGLAIGEFVIVPCFLSYVAGFSLRGLLGRSASWLGERTYSIYLWQQPFTICDLLPSFLAPFGLFIALGVGEVSYNFLERPFLASRQRKTSS